MEDPGDVNLKRMECLFGDGSGKAVTNRGLERHWRFTV